MEEHANRKLRKDGHSEVMEAELVAGRLYTGPMYSKYNAVLRAKSGNKHLIEGFERLCKGNSYAAPARPHARPHASAHAHAHTRAHAAPPAALKWPFRAVAATRRRSTRSTRA